MNVERGRRIGRRDECGEVINRVSVRDSPTSWLLPREHRGVKRCASTAVSAAPRHVLGLIIFSKL